MSLDVRVAAEGEMDEILALRHQVFCVEQGVPRELEQDGRDPEALHLVAVDGEAVVGTCRILTGSDPWKLGRMAVRADRREAGIGRLLLDLAHRLAARAGVTRITLSAQASVQGFYARQGYIRSGGEFMDAGIPHVTMDREIG